MGLWSSIKNKVKKAAKKVWNAVKSVVRQVVRIVVEVVGRALGVFDLLFGFAAWPPKKIRIQIFILSDQNGNPMVSPGDLTPSIDWARKVFKDRLNVKLKAYGDPIVQTITEPAPSAALNVHCDVEAWGEEFGQAGDYFARHLAGWNAVPVSLTFPVTVFIVNDVSGKIGCSLGPLTDYVTVDRAGVKSITTMAHEIGHACGLWHYDGKSNLMWADNGRGDEVAWWQKNLFRSSRHVMYW